MYNNLIEVFSATTVKDRHTLEFDPAEYSKFKYGSKSIARKFGKELGTKLGDWILKNVDKNTQIVICPSPYMFIPTATFALKNYVISWINPILVENGYKVLQDCKVYRETKYTEEYGDKTAEERKSLIGSETFHIDREFLVNKFVIFLDDIRITGSHQERMVEMIYRMELDRVCTFMFAYYSILEDPKSDPTIENYLNMYSIKKLLDLDNIIKNDEFIFNTRNVKYILNAPHIDCVNFLEYQRRTFIESLYYEALGNSYHLAPEFKLNFQYLEHLIHKK